ncbi:hypothetical protein ROZALSC1DRAFT_27257 [Rozella allomycis CSF55]|uniref:Endophilin-B1-like protein n=1 Tax=Rozella allomycis (strain CSF55) TaxID=988480 RepID=A0A075AWW7_ROZAC|nr:Endophilin-B1-like protein [Rozella allomycis CSF55]RKP21328.1 hypothetical protein ROZALSC1DRAFT_27257 [Rozella allomycis CSF55]|eukprot:EPZ34609.1 Endophilin-B1-like protein [Rozella allomycis CSF55]
MGKADEITPFPQEYVELESKMEKYKSAYEGMCKVAQKFIYSNNYEPAIQESVMNVVSKVNESITKRNSVSTGDKNSDRTLHMMMATTTMQCGEMLPENEIFGEALKNYAFALEKVSSARDEMDDQIALKFLAPFMNTLDGTFQIAAKARKAAQKARLELDTVKSRLRQSSNDKIEMLSQELKLAEEQFNLNVEDAILHMKAVTENPDLLKQLNDMIEAQLNFFKKSYEALNALII